MGRCRQRPEAVPLRSPVGSVGAENQVARGEDADRFALSDLYRRAPASVVLGGDGGSTLASATDDDSRRTATNQRPRAAEDREQDGRAEAREEVAVDLAADAG